MPLNILNTTDERLVGASVAKAVRAGLDQGGAVLLVPTFDEALLAQKSLAEAGLTLGIEVSTPRAWVRDRWDVWGDGRRLVDGTTRALVMSEVLSELAHEGVDTPTATPGYVRLLCDLAARGLPWIDEALKERGDALSPAELESARMLGRYDAALARKGLVEEVTCACELPLAMHRAGVRLPAMVFAGFSELSRAQEELLVGLARLTEVTLAIRLGNDVAGQTAVEAARQAGQRAARAGVEVRHANDLGAPAAERVDELDELLGKLFRAAADPVMPTGAVRLLEPSGPLAEAELVAREVAGLVGSGCGHITIVVPDVRRAWRELVPKLVARGVDVTAQLSVPVLETEPGRAFMGYARTVARLQELSCGWPQPLVGEDGLYVQIGNMDWWPPAELVDFMLNEVSGVGPQRAQALDVAWRGDRLLSPQDVLDQLLSSRATSAAVERATRELLKGRLGSAASKLLASYAAVGATDPVQGSSATVSMAREEAVGVLAAVLGVAGTLKELGITADPSVPQAVGLTTLVGLAEQALQTSRVVLRPSVKANSGKGTALVVGRSQAVALGPASTDAAVLCGLTSVEFGVPSADDELSGMLEDLGLEPRRDALASQRARFHRLCALPRKHLLLERTMFSADASEAYPAVMLTEVLSCYEGELRRSGLAEDCARANLSATGTAPGSSGHEPAAAAGVLDESLRRLVTVPQEGREELPGSLPVLSASQLESYLECPLKWFSLRRLRLGNNDAGFGPLEMGTFAHRVLELTYGQLFEEGRAVLRADDAESLQHARDVLGSWFDLHLQHQRMRTGSHPAYQALVPHSSLEESGVDRLRRDLLSSLDYVATRLCGYEPRAFEWDFGRGDHADAQRPCQGGLPSLCEASYAGVRVTGTVDRIDINAHGQAVIIDYKHKGPTGFFAEYAAFRKGAAPGNEFVLPRRIQALLYAQVVRRAFPDLKVVGALYLGTRGTHELSGAVAQNQSDAVFGGQLGMRRSDQVVVPEGESFGMTDAHGMQALLDATEQAVASKVERLRAGHIEAEPVDAAACSFCPVSNCERRLAR